jgi:hypothetical protein
MCEVKQIRVVTSDGLYCWFGCRQEKELGARFSLYLKLKELDSILLVILRFNKLLIFGNHRKMEKIT